MRHLLIAATCLVAASVAGADEASHRAAAKEVLVVTNAKNLSSAMSEQVVRMVLKQMQASGSALPPERAADLEKFQADLAKMIAHELRFETMQDEFIDIYVKEFSEQDLRDMVAFYKTPLGQKMLTKMPVIMESSMEVGQRHAMAMAPQVQAKVEAFLNAQKAKGGKKPAASADPDGKP